MPRSRPSKARSEPEKQHAQLSPSGSARWLKCRGSVGFIEKNAHRLPARESSEHADEGTEAHRLAKLLLTGKALPSDADEEMVAHVELFARHVRTQQGMITNGRIFIERPVPLFYSPNDEGTPDVIITGDTTTKVIDLKYGEGVSVEAVRNSQLAIYLKSALVAHKLKLRPDHRVELEIYQPRARDGRIVRRWSTTMRELDEFAAEIHEVAVDIQLDPDNQPFFPDEDTTCRWCKAKSICTARTQALFQEMPEAVAVVPKLKASVSEFPTAEELSPEQMARILRYAGPLKSFLEDVQELAAERARSGDPVPDTKFVLGRGSRDWSDEDDAMRHLKRCIPRDELYVRTLLSPAQAEARLKRGGLRRAPTARWSKAMKALIVKTEGSPILVHASDPRPPVDIDGRPLLTEADKDIL